jgi:putative tricarboxylic transport membrane protein
MTARDRWSAGALALLALAALVLSRRLDVGSVTQPGPGFFPMVLGSALLLVAVILGAGAFRAPAATSGPAGDRIDLARLLITLGAFGAYVIAFEALGFVLATVLWLAFQLGAIARYRWPIALGAGAVIALISYLLFDTWLGVRLPPGVLGRW